MKKIIITILFMLTSINLIMAYTPLTESFYDVSSNEIFICASDFSTEFNFDEGTSSSSQNQFYNAFFGTAVTVQAYRSSTPDGYLYEVGWYIHPVSTMQVNISYKSATEWINIETKTVSAETSWKYFQPFYLNEDVEYVRLTYPGFEYITEVVKK